LSSPATRPACADSISPQTACENASERSGAFSFSGLISTFWRLGFAAQGFQIHFGPVCFRLCWMRHSPRGPASSQLDPPAWGGGVEPGVCVDRFLDIALSFPTLILSVLLLLAVAYWLLGLLGLFEFEVLDLPDGAEAMGGGGVFSALMLKFGLGGLPFAVIYTTLVFFAWIACYFIDYLLLSGFQSSSLRVGAGLALTPVLLFLALPFAGLALQPLRGLFARVEGRSAEALLGEHVRIRSPDVSEAHGVAEYDDGAAGLILQVRAAAGQFRRGDTALVVEYVAESNAYRVTRPAGSPDSVLSVRTQPSDPQQIQGGVAAAEQQDTHSSSRGS
jgi:hypothetical protein